MGIKGFNSRKTPLQSPWHHRLRVQNMLWLMLRMMRHIVSGKPSYACILRFLNKFHIHKKMDFGLCPDVFMGFRKRLYSFFPVKAVVLGEWITTWVRYYRLMTIISSFERHQGTQSRRKHRRCTSCGAGREVLSRNMVLLNTARHKDTNQNFLLKTFARLYSYDTRTTPKKARGQHANFFFLSYAWMTF